MHILAAGAAGRDPSPCDVSAVIRRNRPAAAVPDFTIDVGKCICPEIGPVAAKLQQLQFGTVGKGVALHIGNGTGNLHFGQGGTFAESVAAHRGDTGADDHLFDAGAVCRPWHVGSRRPVGHRTGSKNRQRAVVVKDPFRFSGGSPGGDHTPGQRTAIVGLYAGGRPAGITAGIVHIANHIGKGVTSDCGGIAQKLHALQRGAVSEGIRADRGNAGRDGYLGQFERREGIVADAGNPTAQRKGGHGRTSVKGIVTDACDAVADGHGFQSAAAAESMRTDGGDTVRNGKRRQRGTTAERIVTDGLDFASHRDLVQLIAAVKSVCADCGYAFGKGNIGKCGAVSKGVLSDGGNAFGDHYGFNVGKIGLPRHSICGVIFHGTGTGDRQNTAAVHIVHFPRDVSGDRLGGQLPVQRAAVIFHHAHRPAGVLSRVINIRNYILKHITGKAGRTALKGNLLQACTIGKCITIQGCNTAGQGEFRQRRTIVKGVILDSRYITQIHRNKICALGKGALINGGCITRHCNTRQSAAAVKCIRADGSHIRRNGEISGFSVGIANQCIAVVIVDNASRTVERGAARFHVDCSQVTATGKGGRRKDGNIFRNGELRQACTVAEHKTVVHGIIIGTDAGNAVRNGNRCQVDAAVKGTGTDAGNTFFDDDRTDLLQIIAPGRGGLFTVISGEVVHITGTGNCQCAVDGKAPRHIGADQTLIYDPG